MPRLTVRALRFPALAVSSLLLLTACGGGNDAGPDQLAVNPQPPKPDPNPPPTNPPPTNPPPADPPPTNPPPTLPPADPPPVNSPPPPPPPPVVLADTYTDLVAGTIGSQPNWPAWVGTGRPVGGVGCLVNEDYHLHSLVSIYRNGVRLGLPDNIGRSGCAYELHTHDVTGVVHIETDVPKKFTLGQFFGLWNQALGANGAAGLAGPIRYYLIENEKLTPFTGDPAQLELVAHREIVIISGTAPSVLPKYRWPSGL